MTDLSRFETGARPRSRRARHLFSLVGGCLTLAALGLAHASDPPAELPPPGASTDIRQFKKVIAFGDSLTDQGRLHTDSAGICPSASCGYFEGRFSNGFNWFDFFLNDTTNAPAADPSLDPRILGHVSPIPLFDYHFNRAFGGARVIAGSGLPVPSVTSQMDEYAAKCTLGRADSICPKPEEAFIVIWGGAVDYLLGSAKDDPNEAARKVIASLGTSLDHLLTRTGMRHVLLVNLPPLGSIPEGSVPATDAGHHQFQADASEAHNRYLDVLVNALRQPRETATVLGVTVNAHPDVTFTIANVHDELQSVINGSTILPGISNTSVPCVTGFYCAFQQVDASKLGPDAVARTKCVTKPDCSGRLFMDYAHPTATGHCLTATLAEEALSQNGYSGFPDGDRSVRRAKCGEYAQAPSVATP